VIDTGCCGLPHHARGQHAAAEQRFTALARTLERFERVYLPCASGYTFLKERLGEKIQLLSQAVSNRPVPVQEPVYYHRPCHLAGQGRDEQDALNQALELTPWPSGDQCCGSGGLYFLTHPRISKKILARIADPDPGQGVIITSCPSCILQLRRTLGGKNRVVHPVRLLADSLY
jgi:Fe-S oxidoreductase